MTRPHSILVVPFVSFTILAAGCGGGTSTTSTAAGSTTSGAGESTAAAATQSTGETTLQLEANSGGALEFNTKSLEAPTGKVTIVMTNPSSVPHDIAITGNGVSVIGPVVSSGAKSTVTAELKPGTYTFYCSVDAHRAAGMQGTLTVK
jgi:plastocyanin